MKVAYLLLLAGLSQGKSSSTGIIKDHLQRGHVPEKVFKPFSKGGAPVPPERKDLAEVSSEKEMDEDACLHVEQMVDYNPTPV
mmetsp:Transcript_24222/g.37323  ORF Transcript_24222/g.37323 Transcript_24222/m.37323 type:complete len:83 (-) Transcript_24222:162-410(-)